MLFSIVGRDYARHNNESIRNHGLAVTCIILTTLIFMLMVTLLFWLSPNGFDGRICTRYTSSAIN